MSEHEKIQQVEQGSILLNKFHLILGFIIFFISTGVQIGLTMNWKDSAEKRLTALEVKVETLAEIRAELKFIVENVKEIKDDIKVLRK